MRTPSPTRVPAKPSGAVKETPEPKSISGSGATEVDGNVNGVVEVGTSGVEVGVKVGVTVEPDVDTVVDTVVSCRPNTSAPTSTPVRNSIAPAMASGTR